MRCFHDPAWLETDPRFVSRREKWNYFYYTFLPNGVFMIKDVVTKAVNKAKSWVGKFDDEGRELMDGKPKALPVGFTRPPTLHEQLAMFIRTPEFRRQMGREEFESFEDADDFDVDDDPDPQSPYERDFDVAALQAVDKGVVRPPVADDKASRFIEERPFRRNKDGSYTSRGKRGSAPSQGKESTPDSQADS